MGVPSLYRFPVGIHGWLQRRPSIGQPSPKQMSSVGFVDWLPILHWSSLMRRTPCLSRSDFAAGRSLSVTC